jgi:uncharacterized delta-60 repeat protein
MKHTNSLLTLAAFVCNDWRRRNKAALLLFSVALLLMGGAAAVRGQTVVDGFDPHANGDIYVVVVQPDGKILIGGNFTTVSPNGGAAVTRNRIARLNADGTLDTAFNPNANGANGFYVLAIAVQPDGNILVGGSFTSIGGQTRTNIARLDATTGLADSWNPNANSDVDAIAVQADGKILAGGSFTTIGGQSRNRIARLDATTGSADSFDPNANTGVASIAVQTDGKVLAGGDFTSIGGQTRNFIARLDAATGVADSFNPNANAGVASIAVQADGKILAGGFFNGANSIGGQSRNRIARLDATTGSADSFDPNANEGVASIAVQADGKILVCGYFNGPNSIGGQTRNYIARLDATTGLADSFDPNANGGVDSIAVQTDGKVLVGGAFTTLAPNGGAAVTRNYIARLVPATSPGITSASNTTFTVGSNGSFTVTATGSPTPTLSESGALPSGVTFTPATGVLGGTPAVGTAGTYPITFTASNGVGSDAMQSFSLTVNQAPAITSANNTAFAEGSNGSFTVTATGIPTPTLSESGALPSGVTFTLATGVLSGTPAAGTGGTYPITFTASNGVGSPAMQSFTLTVTYLPSGALQVNLAPAGAVSTGAQWQLDGGAFQSSGAVLANVAVGDHTLSFNTVSGWITPGNQTVTIVLGATNVVAATYQPAVGALQVNLGPTGAVSAGAQWQLDGGAFQSSGTILANVPVGSHTVSFNTVGGWVTPGNIAVSVAFNTTNTYSASYTIAPGAVQVTILPASAVAVGAAWRLDGGTIQASGATLANVSNGNHTISFVNITGWTTATNQTVSVSPGSTATATGYYTPLDGLQVTITPSCAVGDGAQWQVDGGSFQNSGDTVTNLVPGKHIVAFNLVGGWTTPINQTVTITVGSTTTATGNYREVSIPGTIIWINAGANQKWSNPTNWDLNRIPTNTDIVLIPHITGTNCVLDVNASISGLLIGDCANGGSDSLDLHGQTLVVNGPITIQSSATLTLDQFSTLIGTNAFLSGVLGWASGTLNGTFTIANSGVLNINNGGNIHYLPNCVITNLGTVNWNDDNLLGGGSSPGTLIYNYGLWNVQGDEVLGISFAGNGVVFNNFGTFRKSGGSSGSFTQLPNGVIFNNSGVVDIQQGNLHLLGGGNFSGGYITTNTTGSTVLANGNYTVNGTVTGTNFIQSGASLINANVINGGLTWLSGSWGGAVTITSNSVVNIYSGGNSHDLPDCVITNLGMVNWISDNLLGGGSSPGTLIYNYGLWNVQGDGVLGVNVAGNGVVFNNFGTVRKSGTSGTSQFGVTFTNTGTLDVQAGIVSLTSTYNLLGGTLRFGFNDLINYGRLALNSSVVLGGPLKVNVGGTFAPTIGSQFQIVSSFGESGVFSSVTLPAGISVNYNNNGAFLLVSGAVPVQILTPQLTGSSFFFQFPTASGQSYTVQRNDDLTTTNWIFYTNIIGSGSVFQFQTPVTTTPAQRFFRISEP